jgi:hypothetical protein
MKIGPTPPPLGSPGGLPDRSAVRAEGFAELGMFGLSRAQAAPAGRAAKRAAAPQSQSCGEADLTLARPKPRQANPLPGRIRVPTMPAGEERADLTPSAPRTSNALPSSDGLCPDPLLPRPAGTEGGAAPEGTATEAAAGPRSPREAPRAPGVSLIMRETDGGAEIIATAPGADLESRLALRRLVEAMLARSGLTLAQFQLNGAPVAPDFLGKTGGPDGTRSR